MSRLASVGPLPHLLDAKAISALSLPFLLPHLLDAKAISRAVTTMPPSETSWPARSLPSARSRCVTSKPAFRSLTFTSGLTLPTCR